MWHGSKPWRINRSYRAEISLCLYYTPCLFQAVAWFSWSDMWEWGQSQGQKPGGKLKAGGMFASLWLACRKLGSVLDGSEFPTQSQCYLATEKNAIFIKVMWQEDLAWKTFIFCDMVSLLLFSTTVCLSIIRFRSIPIGFLFLPQFTMWFDRQGPQKKGKK